VHEAFIKLAARIAATASPGSFMWLTHEKIDPGQAVTFIAALPEAEQAEAQAIHDQSTVRAQVETCWSTRPASPPSSSLSSA